MSKKSNHNDKVFEEAMAKMQSKLPKTYFDQFKKQEDTTLNKALKKEQEIKNLKSGGGNVVIKSSSNKHEPKVNIAKVIDHDAEIKIKEVPKEISIQVQKARAEAKLTQDQLAKLVEVKPSAIKDLESGTGIYDPDLVSKIERKLNTKFDRSWKK